MSTRYGTSYFESRAAAHRYYAYYDYPNVATAVTRKLADGEIHIGKPPLKPGQTCYVDKTEGRYFVVEAAEQPKAT